MVENAVILAGGFGTRLAALGDPRPKPLMPVGGEPLLQAHLRRLASAGVKRVSLSLHHEAPQIEAALKGMNLHGMAVSSKVEAEPLGTAGAIRHAWDFAGGQPAYVLNGDIVTNLPLGEVGAFHESLGADATLWGIEVEDTSRFGVIESGPDGRISAFLEKPEPGRTSSKVINAGTYVLSRALVDRIPAGKCSVERETFPQALEAGLKVHAFVKNAYWIDIGTPEAYRKANEDWEKMHKGGSHA